MKSWHLPLLLTCVALYLFPPAKAASTARATAAVVNGFVVGITIVDAGSGYLEPPKVEIVGSGSGATAVAAIEDGQVSRITVQSAGSGYAPDAAVVIAAPKQSSDPLADGLIARYLFLNNLTDESGNGFHATANNITFTTDRFGRASSAIAFKPDVASRATIPGAWHTLVTNDFTVSFWVRFEEPWSTHSESLIWQREHPNQTFVISVNQDDSVYGPGGYQLQAEFKTVPGGASTVPGHQWTFDALSRWNFVVAAHRQGTNLLFLNGELVSARPAPGTMTLTSGDLVLGGSSHPVSGAYRRSMDDVRIYSRGLSDSEVRSLYLIEQNPSPSIPRRARAVPVLVNGFLVGATITDGGSGYSSAPNVRVLGSGNGGLLRAEIDVHGQVSRISVLAAGAGYTEDTIVRVDPPPRFPSLGIEIATVRLNMSVWEGNHYVVEGSDDLSAWTPLLNFTAEADGLTRDFSVAESGQFFRIRELAP